MICFEYVWIHKVQTLQTCGQTGHLEVIGLQGLFVEGEALTLVDGNPRSSSSWSSRQKKERIAPSILKESHVLTARNSGVSIATSIYLDSTEISIGKREKRQGLEGSRVQNPV